MRVSLSWPKPFAKEHLVEFSEKIGSKVAYSVARCLVGSFDGLVIVGSLLQSSVRSLSPGS